MAEKKDQRHRPCHHIRRRKDFDKVFTEKHSARQGQLVVYVCPNSVEQCRLGISVGKRTGNAVMRNRTRRRIREAFRRSRERLPIGLDIVCVAMPGLDKTSDEIAVLLCTLVPKARRKRSPSRGRPTRATTDKHPRDP